MGILRRHFPTFVEIGEGLINLIDSPIPIFVTFGLWGFLYTITGLAALQKEEDGIQELQSYVRTFRQDRALRRLQAKGIPYLR